MTALDLNCCWRWRRGLRRLRILPLLMFDQQLHLHAAILLAAFSGRVGGNFLVLADADQVEAVCRNAVLRSQVLHHRIRAALAQVVVVLGRARSNPFRR